ncbi:hypothetical protein ISCGN_010077 [Ixodes scapularis]
MRPPPKVARNLKPVLPAPAPHRAAPRSSEAKNMEDAVNNSTNSVINASNSTLKRKHSTEEISDENLKLRTKHDNEYFKCYSGLDIHREMIGDVARTFTYRKGILNNYSSIYQKAVLDLGAGTGILSMFCAQAGARKVYAVEASDIAEVARKVVSSNKVDDQVTVIQSRAEVTSCVQFIWLKF